MEPGWRLRAGGGKPGWKALPGPGPTDIRAVPWGSTRASGEPGAGMRPGVGMPRGLATALGEGLGSRVGVK